VAENDIWRQIVRRAWREEDFKKRLLATPYDVFKEYELQVPEGVTYVVVEDTPELRHMVLPPPPTNDLRVDDFGRDVESGDPGF
jgi:hypothetical protein